MSCSFCQLLAQRKGLKISLIFSRGCTSEEDPETFSCLGDGRRVLEKMWQGAAQASQVSFFVLRSLKFVPNALLSLARTNIHMKSSKNPFSQKHKTAFAIYSITRARALHLSSKTQKTLSFAWIQFWSVEPASTSRNLRSLRDPGIVHHEPSN